MNGWLVEWIAGLVLFGPFLYLSHWVLTKEWQSIRLQLAAAETEVLMTDEEDEKADEKDEKIRAMAKTIASQVLPIGRFWLFGL